MENTNTELAKKELDSFPQETRNRADSIIPEILARFGANSLAGLTERDLGAFRYQANIGADSDLYRLLLLRRRLALAGVSWTPHYNF